MTRQRQSLLISLALALLLVFLWGFLAVQFRLDTGDFGAFYTGATLAARGQYAQLHEERVQVAVQEPLIPLRPEPVYFVRPHVYAAVLSPLAAFSLRQAFVIWIVAQALMLVAVAWWALGRFGPDAIVLLALFPPAVLGIGFGQDPVVYLVLGVASYALHERGRPLTAGFLLGWGLLKPHTVLLFPLAMAAQRRWRMLSGFVLAGVVAGGASLALGGFTGAAGYVRFLGRQQQHLTPTPERMLNITSILANAGVGDGAWSTPLRIAMAVMVAAAFAIVCRRGEWWRAVAAAQAATFLLAPHVYLYDGTLILLPAVLVYFQSEGRWSRAAAAFCCSPVPHLAQLADQPWTVAPALSLLFLLLSLAGESLYRVVLPPSTTKHCPVT